MNTEFLSYVDFLKEEFDARIARNVNYSLRAFARDLKLSSSYLSLILNKRRKLSLDNAFQICTLLNWKTYQAELFIVLVKLEQANDQETEKSLRTELTRLIQLNNCTKIIDIAKKNTVSITDWYYPAILNLLTLKNYPETESEIAHRLKLPNSVVSKAIENLMLYGLVTKVENKIKVEPLNFMVLDTPNNPTLIKQTHEQHLRLATLALKKQPPEVRSSSGLTLTFHPERLREVKQYLKEMSQDFNAKFSSPSDTAVYHLALHFFRLDRD